MMACLCLNWDPLSPIGPLRPTRLVRELRNHHVRHAERGEEVLEGGAVDVLLDADFGIRTQVTMVA